MEEYKLRIDENGDVSSERELSDHERESKLEEIFRMIENPEIHPGEIKRKIAGEIAVVNRLMVKMGNDVSILEGLKIKSYSEQVKALRELGKEVMEADVISKKDFLNIEGRKFKFAIDQFMEGAKEAMRLVKLDDTTINSILSHWRDLMQQKEPEIRRILDRMDSKIG